MRRMCRLFDKLIYNPNPPDRGGYRRFWGVKSVICCDCRSTGFSVWQEPRSICTAPHVAARYGTLRHAAARCGTLRHAAARRRTL